MSRFLRRRLGYTGYFELYQVPLDRLHLFDYSEKRDLYAPDGIINGTPTVFDVLRDRAISHHVSDWRQADSANVEDALRAIRTESPRVVYLYLAGLDAVLHANGTRHAAVEETLRTYETWLEELTEAASARYSEVRLHVFSDHGMTDVGSVSALASEISRAGLRFGHDFGAVYDSTMARFWFHNAEARTTLTEFLASRSDGRILTDRELCDFGCDFPDERYGELFYLLEPGTLLCPSFMGRTPIAGMHGYDPSHPDSSASYLTNIQGAPLPERLVELRDLMIRDSGAAA